MTIWVSGPFTLSLSPRAGAGLALALGGLIGVGCAAPGTRPAALAAAEKLGRLGLVLMDHAESAVPAGERDRVVALEVDPLHPAGALPFDPAGYLLVGVRGREVRTAAEIWRELAAWTTGRPAEVRVRRNPYRARDGAWWEADVTWRLPAPALRAGPADREARYP